MSWSSWLFWLIWAASLGSALSIGGAILIARVLGGRNHFASTPLDTYFFNAGLAMGLVVVIAVILVGFIRVAEALL